ncbi:MAG: nucleotidyl transferase AbiEii/AbiGii toxin family protein [Acidaminobacter sp.]|uniref:nucleotidyl transferase AbiEii/AbiGii toxin family protein n=1 Tax=Acidaminobacter sp. TaxID=1872102 RepID=UPI00137D739D|nr:nucleotidyl transferase AbiEii/AbiGii toxin family protein [Acidaminobacter sp.]MZQ98393.1 nucleotidyl transferase AbiEii/AbiGii toxin family protein [Acidaminobacter sp.]
MTNADSIKAKLKNQAALNGNLFNDMLIAYCIERTIYRIAISEHCENFTLKGGIFLYAIFKGDFTRVTTDIDLLATSITNELTKFESIFKEIFSIKYGDAITYDLNSLKVRSITEFKKYHGINLSVFAYLDRTKIPITIDIGFGDVIHPNRVLMNFPVILDMDTPQIYAYSLASVISEKFEAIVNLGYANSRLKDFYDIYVLLSTYDFVGHELAEALKETFAHRGTNFNDIVAFEEGFANDTVRISRWNAFVKKKKAMVKIDFEEVIESIKVFLIPVIDCIQNKQRLEKKWVAKDQTWKF